MKPSKFGVRGVTIGVVALVLASLLQNASADAVAPPTLTALTPGEAYAAATEVATSASGNAKLLEAVKEKSVEIEAKNGSYGAKIVPQQLATQGADANGSTTVIPGEYAAALYLASQQLPNRGSERDFSTLSKVTMSYEDATAPHFWVLVTFTPLASPAPFQMPSPGGQVVLRCNADVSFVVNLRTNQVTRAKHVC